VFGWREERSQPEPTRSVGSLVQQGRSGAIPKKDAGLGRSQKSTERDRTGALPSSPLPHAPISRPSGEFLCFSRIFLRLLRLGNNAAPPGLHASPVGLGAHAPADHVLSYAVPMPAVASRSRPVLCAPSCSPGLCAPAFASACGCAPRGGVCLSLVLRTAHVFFASSWFCTQLVFFFCLSSVLRTTVLFFLPQHGSACSSSSCSYVLIFFFASSRPDLLVLCCNQCLF
jgi:hypothetical protein